MRLLDLFCKAGGCSMGYHRAGFTSITGVDVQPQKRYPFNFVQDDAFKYLMEHGAEFDAIHASPPCQAYSQASFTKTSRAKHPDLLAPTRSALLSIGVPWVMENVPGAPVQDHPIELCGLMFGLKVFRHRWFESSVYLWTPKHPSHRGKLIGRGGMCCVVGHGGGVSGRMRAQFRRDPDANFRDTKADWEHAMGIDWMRRDELSQTIPPAYTEFIGKQLLESINAR